MWVTVYRQCMPVVHVHTITILILHNVMKYASSWQVALTCCYRQHIMHNYSPTTSFWVNGAIYLHDSKLQTGDFAKKWLQHICNGFADYCVLSLRLYFCCMQLKWDS